MRLFFGFLNTVVADYVPHLSLRTKAIVVHLIVHHGFHVIVNNTLFLSKVTKRKELEVEGVLLEISSV